MDFVRVPADSRDGHVATWCELGSQGPPDCDPHGSGLLALGRAVDDDVGEHA